MSLELTEKGRVSVQMCVFHVLGTIFYKYTVPCLNDTA